MPEPGDERTNDGVRERYMVSADGSGHWLPITSTPPVILPKGNRDREVLADSHEDPR